MMTKRPKVVGVEFQDQFKSSCHIIIKADNRNQDLFQGFIIKKILVINMPQRSITTLFKWLLQGSKHLLSE